jgi:iron complex outermembrane receptor protein
MTGAVDAALDCRCSAPRRAHLSVRFGMLAVGLSCTGAHAQEMSPGSGLLPTVEVVGSILVPGLDTPLRQVPANVQVMPGRDLARSGRDNIADYLARAATSVSLNAAQGNDYQPDLNFRGFTASPLLGVPQGLSVYQDGVRLNEPFGDAVNWDLIPPAAIAGLQLVPGSNPVYGLNTLGGTISVVTKNGRTHPGASVQLTGGAHGRRGLEAELGGVQGDVDYFVAANRASDNGWAAHNESEVRQLFAQLGMRVGSGRIDASITGADNRLSGSQTLPLSFADDIRQAYTYPDTNVNRLLLATVRANTAVSDQVRLSGNMYYRRYRNRNLSSNVNDDFDPSAEAGAAEAFNDRSAIAQYSFGAALQANFSGQLARHRNELLLGASLDAGRASYTLDSQPATFTADRGTMGMGGFERDTDALTRNRYAGLYFSNMLALSESWALTLSGRYNRATIEIRDIGGANPKLNASHRFSRFNPAVGIAFSPRKTLTLYASYNEGTRAPTPMELTCADPDDPCKLPNAFLADPLLRQVVVKTVEAGARGQHGMLSWSAATYRSELDDDIQFVSSGGFASTAGYFRNIGTTRRQGVELAGSLAWKAWTLAAAYGLVDATYRSGFAVNSPVNSTADALGAIAVLPGARMPAIARQTLKLTLRYVPRSRFELGANFDVASGTFARGDENNADVRGKLPGYGVINLDSRYLAADGLEFFARVDNLFDRRYATLGMLGLNAFAGPSRQFDPAHAVGEQFRGYAAPRTIVAGVKYAWR